MLLRFDPFRDFDRVFDELRGRAPARSMPMDAYRRGDRFVVHFDIPGVDADSIEVTVDQDILTVKADRAWKEEEGDEIVARERPQGTFERQLYLSERLDREHLEARYDNGVLTVRMPLLEAAKPHKIQIEVSSSPKAVGAKASGAPPTKA